MFRSSICPSSAMIHAHPLFLQARLNPRAPTTLTILMTSKWFWKRATSPWLEKRGMIASTWRPMTRAWLSTSTIILGLTEWCPRAFLCPDSLPTFPVVLVPFLPRVPNVLFATRPSSTRQTWGGTWQMSTRRLSTFSSAQSATRSTKLEIPWSPTLVSCTKIKETVLLVTKPWKWCKKR